MVQRSLRERSSSPISDTTNFCRLVRTSLSNASMRTKSLARVIGRSSDIISNFRVHQRDLCGLGATQLASMVGRDRDTASSATSCAYFARFSPVGATRSSKSPSSGTQAVQIPNQCQTRIALCIIDSWHRPATVKLRSGDVGFDLVVSTVVAAGPKNHVVGFDVMLTKPNRGSEMPHERRERRQFRPLGPEGECLRENPRPADELDSALAMWNKRLEGRAFGLQH